MTKQLILIAALLTISGIAQAKKGDVVYKTRTENTGAKEIADISVCTFAYEDRTEGFGDEERTVRYGTSRFTLTTCIEKQDFRVKITKDGLPWGNDEERISNSEKNQRWVKRIEEKIFEYKVYPDSNKGRENTRIEKQCNDLRRALKLQKVNNPSCNID